MAYFARKLRYGAHDGDEGASYMALLELAKRKGGRPVGFVLYRRIIQYPSFGFPGESQTHMVRLKAAAAEEAIRRFWPWDERTGKEFPGHDSSRWEKTTLWLDLVAAGGGYERFGYDNMHGKVCYGDWVRVGTPAPWCKRHKHRPPRFGDISHRLPELRARIRELEIEKMHLESDISDLENYDDENDCNYVPEENENAVARIEEKIERVREDIAAAETNIEITKAEMRYKVYRMFPKPMGIFPKRISRAEARARGRGW